MAVLSGFTSCRAHRHTPQHDPPTDSGPAPVVGPSVADRAFATARPDRQDWLPPSSGAFVPESAGSHRLAPRRSSLGKREMVQPNGTVIGTPPKPADHHGNHERPTTSRNLRSNHRSAVPGQTSARRHERLLLAAEPRCRCIGIQSLDREEAVRLPDRVRVRWSARDQSGSGPSRPEPSSAIEGVTDTVAELPRRGGPRWGWG